jgi:cytidylate kinase
MQIITIYQGASGSGEELADGVAQALGYGCVDREVLVHTSLQYGIPETKLNEIVEREPSWWATFTRNLDPYRIALQAAFCEIARDNGIVYHGHLGHELIPKFQHVLKILLTAPMEMRIEQVRARHKLNESAARRYVEEVDKARTRRLQGMFGTDWRDASRYDLVVNLGYMSLSTAKKLIVDAAHAADYRMTPASKRAFENFALASRVRATLALAQDLSQVRVEVDANDGDILVSGTVPEWVTAREVISHIETIPGIKHVRAELTTLPASLGMTN